MCWVDLIRDEKCEEMCSGDLKLSLSRKARLKLIQSFSFVETRRIGKLLQIYSIFSKTPSRLIKLRNNGNSEWMKNRDKFKSSKSFFCITANFPLLPFFSPPFNAITKFKQLALSIRDDFKVFKNNFLALKVSGNFVDDLLTKMEKMISLFVIYDKVSAVSSWMGENLSSRTQLAVRNGLSRNRADDGKWKNGNKIIEKQKKCPDDLKFKLIILNNKQSTVDEKNNNKNNIGLRAKKPNWKIKNSSMGKPKTSKS